MSIDIYTRDIEADVEAGDELLTLNRARHLPQLRVDGRPHNINWVHRAAIKGCRGVQGSRVVLETTTISGRKLTTRSAVLRFIHRQSEGTAGPTRAEARQHNRAVAALARAGI